MNLEDCLSVAAEEPGEADSVGACSLDFERHQLPVGADVGMAESEQLLIPCDRCRDEQFGKSATESVEQDGDVLVLVSVDADDDIVVS